jgi:AraC family transcriptional regulator of arabinose operon
LRCDEFNEKNETKAMPEILRNISRVNLRMRRGAVVFGEVVYSPRGICGPRIQHDYQLVIMHQGELELHLDGKLIEVAARHAILLVPGHREHFIFSRNRETRHSWCSVDAGAIPQKLRRSLRSSCGPVPVDSRIEALMELGKTTYFEGQSDPGTESTFHLSLALALLAGYCLGVQAKIPVLNSGQQTLARAEQFILTEFGRHLSLMDLAMAAGVSRQHLLKLFRNRRGTSPTRYLYERRLGVAADQLIHTGLSIKEIAGYCGFANEFHFSRKFKAAYGKSPRDWRSQKWSSAG